MDSYYVLYNPMAANGRGKENAQKLVELLPDSDLHFTDITQIQDLTGFFAGMEPQDQFILCGGDGTLNHFVNAVDCTSLPEQLYYYPAGSGNDFWNDIKADYPTELVNIHRYLEELPRVTVKGNTCRFLNNVGYGIDGYCCAEGDRQRETADKPVNYTGIAIKGLLFHHHPATAAVTVDGVKRTYRKVWLAPTMNGRYYGGGMMCAPDQDRLNRQHLVSVVVAHNCGKWKILSVFPSIFQGKHVKHRKNIEVLTGHDITVSFDAPCALQIDGETILNVTEYHVTA